ncbi:hypothetical protein [Aeromicrobium sp. NPDC092404]|uniref:hypothetical protein n=1 Tax=Aeromicrobium sp. NPDC092404 TaxID=3154976 RepID=UPI0034386452
MTEQQPPITYELSTPDEAPAGGGRNTKRLAFGAIATVVVLALAGGAFAVVKKLDGGGAQPHDVLPSSVVAYARVDVDPSASQKIALFKLIRKFPEAADDVGIKSADQDVRKLLVEEALEEGDCDLSYDDDVKPWLGSRIGVALDDEQVPLVAIQVSDEEKAEKGIKDLFACDDEKAAVAFLDGYAIVAETQKQADAAVKAAEKKPLADNAAFASDFEDLGEQGVASAWGDFEALAEIPDFKAGFASAAGPDTEKMLKQAGTMATTLRVDGSTLELAGLSGLTDAYDTKGGSLDKLPADTVAALSVGGVGKQVSAQYDAFFSQLDRGFGSPALEPADGLTPEQQDAYDDFMADEPVGLFDPAAMIAEFERSTGLKLPEDLETLFGESLTVSIGSSNLENVPALSGPADVAELDVALKMTTDPAKAIDLATRLAALASQVGIELPTKETDDGAIIATNEDAAEAIDTPNGKLGDDDTFTSVMPYGDDTAFGLFVDVGTILDKLMEADPPDDVAKDIEEARTVKAVGLSGGKDGEHSVFSLRVSFAK